MSITLPSPYAYNATLKRVVDGDTIDVVFDLGFNISMVERLRLYDINAPEMFGPHATPAGKLARDFVVQWMPEDGKLLIDSRRYDARGKYGRVLADVYKLGYPQTLNEALLLSGNAVTVNY